MIRLKVDSIRCAGCKICQLSCSFHHEGSVGIKMARMRVEINRSSALNVEAERIDLPIVCEQCQDAPCAEVCPVGAFVLDGGLGIYLLDEGTCTGCGVCIDACPHRVLIMHPGRNVPVKCDLCAGEPRCAKNCPTQALKTTS